MGFFHYHQNNSGGSFHEPAIDLIIEADSPGHADSLAEDEGAYFDGCAAGRDCDCCGDRWYRAGYTTKGDAVPTKYGSPIELDGSHVINNWSDRDQVPSYLIVYKDGTKKVLK